MVSAGNIIDLGTLAWQDELLFSLSATVSTGHYRSSGGSEVVLEARKTANLACFRWLRGHEHMFQERGGQPAAPCPCIARVKFGSGEAEIVRCAAGAQIAVV